MKIKEEVVYVKFSIQLRLDYCENMATSYSRI